ncbi:hypothetical protein ASG37_00105 [Sphingomonas sp. Leaf407]|uniref:hypothetical protein n=1 Tax=unclassified Sphingomonas TaxID=196159 RepID=UPI0006F320A8|nr:MULTISPECIES: hypothetical protein [unclassified Sphingomonas]KQN40266.1 hypothetical protein ASE97_00135 [Sphingomonas sp. Leaf42]KQT29620.1 hypothetical protein ASG37_00105 [Sphingomonas sp. Leaf407]
MRSGPWLQAFSGRFLHLRFRSGATHRVEIVERPRRTLSPADFAALEAACRTVVAACLDGRQLDYGLFAPDGLAWDRSVVTLIRDASSGAPVAFNAMPLLPVERGGVGEEVLHLGLVMVDPAARSGGLSWILYGLTCFALFVRRGLRPLWISSVTQVPAVVGMVAETFDDVYPAQAATRASFAHRHLAHQIMRGSRAAFGVGAEAGFDPVGHVITDAYTGGSDHLKKRFDVAAKHRDERYNRFCAETLDYDRGDDVLQIGRIDLATARRFLSRSVPRHAVPQLAVQGAIIAVQAVVAPLLQWLAADRPLGRLRPVR